MELYPSEFEAGACVQGMKGSEGLLVASKIADREGLRVQSL